MRRIILASITLGVAAGVIWTHHDTLGITDVWPVALGVALAAPAIGRLGAVATSAVAGIVAAWAVFIAVTLLLPFIPVSFGITVGVALTVLGVGAGAIRGASLPAMLAGFAAFYAVYEPSWVDDRPGFLGNSASAAATVAVTVLGGMAVYAVIDRVIGFARAPRAVAARAEIDIRERTGVTIDVTEPTEIDLEHRMPATPPQGGIRPQGAH